MVRNAKLAIVYCTVAMIIIPSTATFTDMAGCKAIKMYDGVPVECTPKSFIISKSRPSLDKDQEIFCLNQQYLTYRCTYLI